MIILLLTFCTLAAATFIVLSIKNFSKTRRNRFGETVHAVGYNWFFGFSIVFGVLVLIFTIATISMFTTVATENVIDSEIEMYQLENTKIEKSIDTVVQGYMKHERDTFGDLKTEESLITLVTLFPELKSDALVQRQLEIYVSNNEMIRSLKEEKIMIMRTKWLLYFKR